MNNVICHPLSPSLTPFDDQLLNLAWQNELLGGDLDVVRDAGHLHGVFEIVNFERHFLGQQDPIGFFVVVEYGGDFGEHLWGD